MPLAKSSDIVVVGGGIVGLATARALLSANPGLKLQLLEKEASLAAHQTGHNSGVIHSGLYYRPGSVKARLCVAGRQAMYAYCRETGIAHRQCGKLVVASRQEQLPQLDELGRRGAANGLKDLRRVGREELAEIEPDLAGVAGLWVPETGVVDFAEVARSFGRDIVAAGGQVRTSCLVRDLHLEPSGVRLDTSLGQLRAGALINCAGLHSDRVARLAGIEPGVRIVPFRGEYFHLQQPGADRVRGLIYPVPDPGLPFLGVHLTRSVHDEVEAGPNAVLAFKREGYRRSSFSLRDCWDIVCWPGCWRLGRSYWRTGLQEFRRSFSRARFLADLQQLVPVLTTADLGARGAGVRAQAVDRGGKLLDDFSIHTSERMIHVLNAPSPAATASLAIGAEIARQAAEQFNLSAPTG